MRAARSDRSATTPALTAVALDSRAGGLEESVTEETLRAAFVPFGEITELHMPVEGSSKKHKGFAFVQFDEMGDAAEAIDNMHNAELFGRVLRVNLAKGDSFKGGHRPVWEAGADDYFNKGEDAKTGAGGAGDEASR